MVFQNVTMNLNALSNITPFNSSGYANINLDTIVDSANSYTNDLWVFGALSVFFIISYVALTDKTGFTNFGFDDMRGLFVSFAICIIMAVQLIEIGWSVNFYSVGFFSSAYLVNGILIIVYESKSGGDI